MYQLSENTIGQWLEKWAVEDPDKEFVVYSDRNLRWTFSYFNSRVDELAKGLMSMGVKKNTHVGIWAPNIPDWLTMMFACAKIGAVSITVNTNFKQFEVEDLCLRSDMDVLCIGDHSKDNSFVDMTYTMLPELRTLKEGEELHNEKLPCMKHVIYFGTENHRGMLTLNDVMMRAMLTSDEDYSKAKSMVNAHELANIQYTSGTTGFPKGAMLSHYGIANNGALTGEHINMTENSKLCICVPFFHCFGLVLAVMNCLTHHCTMVITENYNPLLVLASIQRERCTHLYGVPTMFLGVLNHPMFNMFNISSLKCGIMAGAMVPVELAKRVEKEMFMKLTTVYGFTESSPGMTATRWDEPFEVRIGTVGKEFEYTEVVVLDDNGNLCPDGVEGELCNRGYNSMLGYYKDEASTKEILDDNNYLHTGDLGYKDKDGYFHVTGRKKEMIIRGGENIYPNEIENFLYTMPQIKFVQVVGVPSEKYGESVGAFIELKKGEKLTDGDIRDYCRNQIARYKVPKYIFFLNEDEWPLTGSGKIQKFKLKERSLEICKERGIKVI